MRELIGYDLYNAFVSGGKELILQTNFLNKINMFPVADKDTGNNLAHTLNAVINNAKPEKSVTSTMESIAQQALLGARGNSGIIFAQFFQGLAEKTRGKQNLRIIAFCEAVSHAVKQAYEAIYSPVEGSVLTAMRVWSETLQKFKHSQNFSTLFRKTQPFLDEAVKNTVKYAHNKNNVDAGAQGFLYFVKGFARALNKVNHKTFSTINQSLILDIADEHNFTQVPKFRFCTEFFLQNLTQEVSNLRDELHQFGDSLVVAGNKDRARIHIHTNNPAHVAEMLEEHASLVEQKADDMLRQYEVSHSPKHHIAIVVDSGCDLPQDFIEENQIHILPLFINAKGTSYLDKLTLTLPRLHKITQESEKFPTSAQPSPGQIQALYKNLLNYYEGVVSIHISSGISGTFNTVKQVSKQFGNKIVVVDSQTLSGGMAIFVRQALAMIKSGISIQEIGTKLTVDLSKQDFYLSIQSLDYIRRSGRITGLKKILLGLIKLQPLMQAKDGKISVFALTASEKIALNKLVRTVKRKIQQQKLVSYSLFYSSETEKVTILENAMFKLTGLKPKACLPVSAAIALSIGEGGVGLLLEWD